MLSFLGLIVFGGNGAYFIAKNIYVLFPIVFIEWENQNLKIVEVRKYRKLRKKMIVISKSTNIVS
jgi:hypothetical protein